MVVVVPEHGGALKGDRMQVSGLRDIPSPSITDVPVGVKFFGMKAPHQGAPIVIEQPSSFTAISVWWFAFSMARFSPKTMLTGKTHQWVATNSTGLRELKCSSYSIPG